MLTTVDLKRRVEAARNFLAILRKMRVRAIEGEAFEFQALTAKHRQLTKERMSKVFLIW